ncbi:MAG: DNA polymerase III subunit beta [Alphaproteobacteria bacterium]|jgi:DNA polymerase-3 subunit beta|nr:DNA polymerase III subunit beta [Alphaproteobacteria bacterium]MDP6566098.1 DNA polymerase III subunit beta [Alphaproteobacteria bacterium]
MKLTIERSALLRALAHVQNVVERRNTIPILSNVQMVADDAGLNLTATDLDLAIVETAACDLQQAGGTTAPAHVLYDIVRKLPDGAQVEFDSATEEGRLLVRAARSKFALSCLPREDFPVMADGELPHQFDLPAPDLRRLIEKTRFAISTEETRYYLNGIYLHAPEGANVLRGVATDGHRLAHVEVPLPSGAAGMPGVIVPRKTVLEVHKLIEDGEGAVQVALSESKVRFAFDDIVLTSKLIDGTFPDYQRVIPEGNDKHMEVDCKIFADAVDRVATISSEKSRAVKLSLNGDALVLSANSPEQGSGTDEVAVSYDGGDPLEIGFNARYLLDIASQIDGDNARFDLSDAASPTIIRDAADEGALYVLMPMRV